MGGEIHALALRTLTPDEAAGARLSAPRESRPMAKIIITGGETLNGEVQISGAKNAVLPILCATLLADAPIAIGNVPHLHDVTTTVELLGALGAQLDHRREADASPSTRAPSTAPSRPTNWSRPCARRSWCWARCWRSSATPKCRCPAAARSVRGRSTSTSAACRRWAPTSSSRTASSRPSAKRLKGGRYVFDMVTVTGTENVLMAAVLAEGTTVLENCARGTRSRRPGRTA